MALLDDLHRMVSVEGNTARNIALHSAYWLYERNPHLSLEEQAEGFAFLTAACLRETNAEMRYLSLLILKKISQSRSHQIGAQVDWAAFIDALPRWTTSREMHVALVLLCDANDARYLSVLEHYFDHPDQYGQALSSWMALAYTERYTFDERVRPYLHEAEKVINERFASALNRRQAEERASGQWRDTRIMEHHWTTLFPGAKAWARQQFALADERIRQALQVQDRRAFQKEYEVRKLRRGEAAYLPNLVRQDLAVPMNEKEYRFEMTRLQDTFTHNMSLPIDEVAETVQVLVDDALLGEDHRWAWEAIATALQTRQYAGLYLDWDRLADVLPSLDDERSDPEFRALRGVLDCLSYAPEERFLNILWPYLDHPHRDVRIIAADGIEHLIRHLAHYCPEVTLLARQIEETPVFPSHIPKTPEAWQRLKERLERFAHDARPYVHYYSI